MMVIDWFSPDEKVLQTTDSPRVVYDADNDRWGVFLTEKEVG